MIENTIWVEKYRPTILDMFVGNEKIKQAVSQYIKAKDIPHLLLHGDPGGGKTTLAKILAKQIADGNYLYINASDENSVDVVRDKIKSFASTVGFGGIKIIILDEADYTTPNFQAALRNVMETYSKNTRFILTCNYVDKIIPAIQSRCQTYNLVPPNKADVAIICTTILNNEGIEYDIPVLADIINTYFPDIRKIQNELQASSITGTLLKNEEICNYTTIHKELLAILLNSDDNLTKIKNIRAVLLDNMVRDFNSIFKFIYDNVEVISPKNPGAIILIVADTQYKDAFVVDHEINAMSMFVQILNII